MCSVQRVSPTCVCIMHEHSTCKMKCALFQERNNVVRCSQANNKNTIMTRGHKQVNVGIFFKVTILVKCHIL